MNEYDREPKEFSLGTVKVPIGFKTDKGSEYEYFADGSGYVVRVKYDKSEHVTRGVTVFLDESSMIQVSKMYTNQEYLPQERKRSWYLMEDFGDKGEYVFETSAVHNPDKLVIAEIDGNNQLRAKYRVNLVPKIGTYPFQQSMKDGRPNLHLGDKVVSLDTSQMLDINLLKSK